MSRAGLQKFESVEATRVRAAIHITGGSLGSLLASLNISTLIDAKLRTCFEWTRMSGVVALAPQETRTDSGLLIMMDPPFGCSLFLGPCITGTGPSGQPSRSRWCGWLVDTEWGRKVGIQFNTLTSMQHFCSIFGQIPVGRLLGTIKGPFKAIRHCLKG